eukprot:388879_1
MADKVSASVPYIPFSEVSFLKRTFVYNQECGQYLAPIDEASISKSLHNVMKRKGSDTLPEKISADALVNAGREYFRHGEAVYTQRTAELDKVRIECDLTTHAGKFPTGSEAVNEYKDMIARPKRFFD